ncbi:MAG: chemotaxis protein CheW [Bacteroidales bacterium]
MKNNSSEFLCFVVENQRFALPLNRVDIVIRSQAVTRLENNIDFLCGVIDLHGDIIPIISLRKRFRLTETDIDITDRFIIVDAGSRRVGIIAEQVDDIITIPNDELKESTEIFNGLRYIRIFSQENGIVLIYDIDSIIDKNEEIELQKVWQSLNHC